MEINLWRGYVGDIVRTGVYSFESIARAKEIGINYFESSDGEEYLFDADKIQTVFSVLMSYAIEFTTIGGDISFTRDYYERDNNYTEFSFNVSYSGTGIETEQLLLTFEKSYQINNEASYNKDEIRRDLIRAKELVELMGGTLTVESEIGKETVFNLQLLLRKSNNENVPFYEFAIA
jgi:signal transduction histidine kinase